MTNEKPWEGRLRVRCPKDDGTSAHVAVDLRSPCLLNGRGAKLLAALRRCHCGAELVVPLGDEPGGAT